MNVGPSLELRVQARAVVLTLLSMADRLTQKLDHDLSRSLQRDWIVTRLWNGLGYGHMMSLCLLSIYCDYLD